MSDDSHEPPVLEITGLCLSYHTRAGEVPAVYDFDLTVAKGESVGLVGESGCGKSTVANGIMRYMGHNGDIVGGTIKFKGRDMAEMSEEEIRRVRGKDIAMIYQEPMASLNPSLTLGAQLMEVPIIHEGVSRAEAFQRAYDMLAAVDIPDPKRLMISYPHQVSGGQQQRVVIAMALLSQPALLLLDEPTTALDVTVEAGIVDLIAELSRKTGSSLLYISHNLGLMLESVTVSASCIRARSWRRGRSILSSPGPSTPTRKGSSAAFRCPMPTRTRARWSRSRASFRSPTSGPRAVISARAAASLRAAGATRA